jgi:hypothetical protein
MLTWAGLAAHGLQGSGHPVTIQEDQAGHFDRKLGHYAEFWPIFIRD